MLDWLPIRFETPAYLALLALLPLIVALSFRSLAGLGPIRRWVAIAARCVVLLLAILALSGAQMARKSDDLSVLYLVDRSSSIPPAELQRAFEFMQASEQARRKDDRIGVIGFDGVAAVDQLPMATLAIDRVSESVQPNETDIAGAARLAMALLPADTYRRVVLVSDGNENVGNVLEEAQQFRAAGVPIDVLPIRYEHSNEVVFERLKAPMTATDQETIGLQMVLRAQKPTAGRILLWHNDQLVDLDPGGSGTGYPVELDAGPNRRVIPIPMRVAGAHRFVAKFEPDSASDDTIVDNNKGEAFTLVSGQGKVLLIAAAQDIEATPSSARILARALEQENLVVQVEPVGAPLDQVRLLEYSAVILSNVMAGDMREEDKNALATYVRDLGGGLIMVGGEDSFGAGGWMGSAVEEVMPVSFDVKNQKQIPKGALVLVMHACEIPRGNYWGERVAVEAVKTLSSRDLIGILSYHWTGNNAWDVPLQEVGNKTGVIQQIMRMQMGDMPDLDEIMRPGVEALLARTDAAAKHMIVISDFDPAAPQPDLIDKMKKGGISCSTVAIGYGGHWIDENKARFIAESTGGKFYRTANFSELPQIFIKESRIVRRTLVQEGTFTPRLANPLSPVIAGMSAGFPDLKGLVLTTPRPLADVPLIRKGNDGDDPVLAHWQVGLGKTVAFTSGMWPRWGADWAAWPRFSKLWAQIVRWCSKQAESTAFDVTTTVQGGVGRVQIDALDKNADVINFMEIQGTLVDPQSKSRPLRLTQTGPGRYEGEFDARDRGNYIVGLTYRAGQGGDARTGALHTGVSVAYSPEFAELKANTPLLQEVATRTGGRVLSPADAKTVFDRRSLPRAETRRTIWEDLVRYMLILFVLDVAIRRIAVNPAELARKLRRFIGEMAGRRTTAAESAAVLSTLRGTRERVRGEADARRPDGSGGRPADGSGGRMAGGSGGRAADGAESGGAVGDSRAAGAAEAGPAPSRTSRYEAPLSPERASEDLSRALGGATEKDAPVVARPTGKKPVQSEADYTSRLLKAKRRAKEDMEGKDAEGGDGPPAG